MRNNYPVDVTSIAQKLMQFDTTNGVGPERDCILYIKGMLESHGIETKLICRDEI